MKRIPTIFALLFSTWLFFQSGDLMGDERLTLYDRNRRNVKSRNSSRSRYEGSGDSQRRYYGGRDYYYDNDDDDDYNDRGRQRTIGRPLQPYE